MKRIHAVELEDLSGFPPLLRSAGMAHLRFVAERTGQATQILPVIRQALNDSGEKEILDLCSGGMGPLLSIAREFAAEGEAVPVTFTDRYPDPPALALVRESKLTSVRYAEESVDAFEVGAERSGLRTFFNSFHHFKPDEGRRLLAAAVTANRPIAIVEVLQRTPLALIGILFAPLTVFFTLPFLRPFRIGWLPFTYLLPLIPLFILWDGVISVLRMYTTDELLALAREADPRQQFAWRVEEIPMKPAPVPGLALLGMPRQSISW